MKQSTHAKETRTLRSGRDQARPHQVVSLRHLPGGHEAKAQRKAKGQVTTGTPRKVVPMGKHPTVAHPALQWERDELLTKLWRTQDQMEVWHDLNRYTFSKHTRKAFNTGKHYHHDKMMGLFQEHINFLKNQLLSLDERISPIQHGY